MTLQIWVTETLKYKNHFQCYQDNIWFKRSDFKLQQLQNDYDTYCNFTTPANKKKTVVTDI